jgi:hypothetical protein
MVFIGQIIGDMITEETVEVEFKAQVEKPEPTIVCESLQSKGY